MSWIDRLQAEGGVNTSEKTDTSTKQRPTLLPKLSGSSSLTFFTWIVMAMGVSLLLSFLILKIIYTQPSSDALSVTSMAQPTSQAQKQKSVVEVDASKPAIGGKGCNDKDKPVIFPGQKSLREAWMTFSTELYAHNASGVEAVLTDDSSMRGQQWDQVFSQLGEADFCLSMEAEAEDGTVRGQLTVFQGENAIRYDQVVTGVEKDGKWLIKEIRKAS